MDQWLERDYYQWFNESEPDYWFGLSADKEHTTPKERQFLFSLGNLSRRRGNPSLKQLKWAKSIVDNIAGSKVAKNEIENSFKGIGMSDILEAKHVTVRMAWHDNGWNGHICSEPDKNDYCIGEYSLLSRRIRQRRKLEMEPPNSCADKKTLNGYIPPCYWSINAFGNDALEIEHEHPMAKSPEIRGTPNISETLPKHSIFTWPFKLSFVRDKNHRKIDGQYPKNLVPRIQRFFSKLKEKQSIVFLYCNYDNPISGDEQKYLIVGCALLRDKGKEHHYEIPKAGLEKQRSKPDFQNFPTISWDIRLSLDPESLVTIPYHSYLKEAEITNNFDLLNQIKVVVDESALVRSFKYVAIDIDDDQAIYLLTKIKRSILRVKEHGRFNDVYDPDENIGRLESLLKHSWGKRGLFPGFLKLARLLLDRCDDPKPLRLDSLLHDLIKQYGEDYADALIEFIENPETHSALQKLCKDEIYELKDALDAKRMSSDDFLRLCLLNLTTEQFRRVLQGNVGDTRRTIKEICENPYLLFEEYEPNEEAENVVTGDLIDEPIELSKIDIAHFPDSRYLSRFRRIQSLKPADPSRVRALVIAHLRGLEGSGDCFDNAKRIEEVLTEYPLFYQSEYHLPDSVLYKPDAVATDHFQQKLVIKNDSGRCFYYLKEIYLAEQFVSDTIMLLLSKQNLPHSYHVDINDSVAMLKGKLGCRFDEVTFRDERTHLYKNVFSKRLFILSGGPGTGKSFELLQIVDELRQAGEEYLILAPTGKATLRLTLNEENIDNIKAKTIDKFLNEHQHDQDGSVAVENLIIDEMSMVDLVKLDSLLRKLNFNTTKFKRLILVGDENQLPPIGFGKVYIDIIRYVTNDDKYRDSFISLNVNCRQQLDDTVIKFSKVYSGQSKNHEVLLKSVLNEGTVSSGLYVCYWKNRDELRAKITARFATIYNDKIINGDLNTAMNRVFNLDDTGYVNNSNHKFCENLHLDRFQIITPYRTAYYGALGLNNYIQQALRGEQRFVKGPFRHSDKIIQTQNRYKKGEGLILSNGSMGILNATHGSYFPEYPQPIPLSHLDDEQMELAYAITVHKSQGSGFDSVFFVFPAKKGLLSRELLYTALTRSKQGVTIFVYGEPGQELDNSLFESVRTTSSVELRKTSLLGQPYWDYTLSPAPDINVKSRIEFIIYRKLQEIRDGIGGFVFEYEKKYNLPWNHYDIKPDFTITLENGKKIYWEHLGKLSDRSYTKDWLERRSIYQKENLMEHLVTTDERRGISDNKIEDIILAIISDDLKTDVTENVYSNHHYYLSS